MTRLLSKLLVTTALLSGPASADTLIIGYWDSALGGRVTPLASSAGTEILWQNQLLGTGFGFGDLVTLLIPNATGKPNLRVRHRGCHRATARQDDPRLYDLARRGERRAIR